MGLGDRLGHQLGGLRVLARAGVVAPMRPDRLAGVGAALTRWGPTLPGDLASAAARWPRRVAVVDDVREVTYRELNVLSDGLARALREIAPVGPGGGGGAVGLLMRNSALLPLAMAAVGKAGLDTVLLNTGSAGPQLAEITQRENVSVVIADSEFAPELELVPAGVTRIVADDEATGVLARARAHGSGALPKPPHPGRIVILTSGTTGTPKGAPRPHGGTAGIGTAIGFFDAVPLRSGGRTVVAAPIFHSWGFTHLMFGLMLGSTLVVSRRFDPERTLAGIERHQADVLVAVPVMLARLLELPEDVRARYDTSSLRVAAVSGSALPGGLAVRFMDAFGDVLYNLYGSTEVAMASLACPADMRADAGTAGRPLRGGTVRIVDGAGREVPAGSVGRIFVGNGLVFPGYTGGGDKERLDGLVASGDVGYFDPAGRLVVTGRDDDLIISGGENVHPGPVEDVLSAHPAIIEAAVVGVPDEKMGQRLVAYVVCRDDLGEPPDGEELRTYVKEKVARHAVPREVIFLTALPRNETGKVVKRLLPQS